MNRGRRWGLAVGMAGLAMVLASGSCRDAEEDLDPPKVAVVPGEGGGRASDPAPAPVAGKSEQPAKLPRAEGRTPDGRKAPAGHREAVNVPGKPGFVFNPYTNNVVDVRGIPPGTLVKDPMDPEKNRTFKVPKAAKPKTPGGGSDDGS